MSAPFGIEDVPYWKVALSNAAALGGFARGVGLLSGAVYPVIPIGPGAAGGGNQDIKTTQFWASVKLRSVVAGGPYMGLELYAQTASDLGEQALGAQAFATLADVFAAGLGFPQLAGVLNASRGDTPARAVVVEALDPIGSAAQLQLACVLVRRGGPGVIFGTNAVSIGAQSTDGSAPVGELRAGESATGLVVPIFTPAPSAIPLAPVPPVADGGFILSTVSPSTSSYRQAAPLFPLLLLPGFSLICSVTVDNLGNASAGDLDVRLVWREVAIA